MGRTPDEEIALSRHLIQDRDRKFTTHFDLVIVSEGTDIVQTPFRAPKADAIAKRWVHSVRHECLDHLLILKQRHFAHMLSEYIDFYPASGPHQGLDRQSPIPIPESPQEAI